MKKFLSLFIAMSFGFLAIAQNSGKISGSLKDRGNQQIIDASSVSLLNSRDSSLVKTSVTDREGNFSFDNVKEGSYLVMATSVGHLKVFSSLIEIKTTSPEIMVGVLQLIPVSKNLKEVVVTTKKPFIERKLDKTILNVEASITNTGSTAMEVLEKAPGVSVDKDGNISLKGKQGVVIMMDGKPTYMSGADLANFLRNLPSSNLDQIEIMTNPSAKYDAAGNSGIINFKTKKNKQVGFNGSLSTAFGQGSYAKTNNSLNLNYRKGKVNLFGTVSANYRGNYQVLDIHRRYINDDKTTKAIFDQESFSKKNRYNYNAKIGMDFYANKKTTMGFVVTGYTTPGNETGTNTSFLKSNSGFVDSIVTADRIEKYTWKNLGVNMNIRHTFDSTGREISADVDYLNYDANKDQLFTNNRYNPDWSKKSANILKGELPSIIKIYSAKLDYTHPFKKDFKMDAGIKFSDVSTDNDAGYFNMVNNAKEIDYDKTNKFQYNENVNAAYINFSRTIKKWGFQAGLRMENTNYNGRQFGNAQHPEQDSSFKNSYTNLFPTAYISYSANDKNQFGFSYGRRINRPDYEDLNPFLFFLDEYTAGAGNPFLRPMYSHVIELSHTYRQFLTTTLNYNRTTDLFNETFEEKGFMTIVRQGNYGLNNNVSLSVSAQVPVAKWWSMNLYGEGRYQEFKGELYGKNINIEGSTLLANVNNQFTFKKGWSAEVSGWYRTKGVEGQILIKPLGQLNAGVQKQVLKNKGTVKLSVRDMLFTSNGSGNINFQNTEASFSNSNDSRVATISFNYRFGKPIKGLQKRKTGGAGDEQNRIKSSN
ncbi:MAG: TonB-dependent receptor [Ferruginibacter sp.]